MAEKVNIGEAAVTISADLQPLSSAIQSAKGMLGGLGGAASVASGVIIGELAVKAASAIADFAITSAKHLIDLEKTIGRLNSTLKMYGQTQAGVTDNVQNYLTLTSTQTQFTQNELANGLNNLLAYTKDYTTALWLNNLALDYAQQQNVHLIDATELIGQAYEGDVRHLRMLARNMGITGAAARDATTLFRELELRVGGVAKNADDISTNWDRMMNSIEVRTKSVWGAISPFFNAMEKTATWVINGGQEAPEAKNKSAELLAERQRLMEAMEKERSFRSDPMQLKGPDYVQATTASYKALEDQLKDVEKQYQALNTQKNRGIKTPGEEQREAEELKNIMKENAALSSHANVLQGQETRENTKDLHEQWREEHLLFTTRASLKADLKALDSQYDELKKKLKEVRDLEKADPNNMALRQREHDILKETIKTEEHHIEVQKRLGDVIKQNHQLVSDFAQNINKNLGQEMDTFFAGVKDGSINMMNIFAVSGKSMEKVFILSMADALDQLGAMLEATALTYLLSENYLKMAEYSAGSKAAIIASHGMRAFANGLALGGVTVTGNDQYDTIPTMLRKNEAVIPLDDPKATKSITDALMPAASFSGTGLTVSQADMSMMPSNTTNDSSINVTGGVHLHNYASPGEAKSMQSQKSARSNSNTLLRNMQDMYSKNGNRYALA